MVCIITTTYFQFPNVSCRYAGGVLQRWRSSNNRWPSRTEYNSQFFFLSIRTDTYILLCLYSFFFLFFFHHIVFAPFHTHFHFPQSFVRGVHRKTTTPPLAVENNDGGSRCGDEKKTPNRIVGGIYSMAP